MDIYSNLRKLAKSTKVQNIFVASKEQSNISIFKNCTDFSYIQEYYLNLLYVYDSLMQDILMHKVSKKILENDLYTDSYLLWRKDNPKGFDNKDKKINNKHDVHLVPSKKIVFKEENHGK